MDNTKRLKMLKDAYAVKHERLMKQSAHLAQVKSQVRPFFDYFWGGVEGVC
jgi:hypothetical protein